MGGSSDSVRLRAITPEDDRFLRAVYASTREEELAIVPWSEEQKRAFLDFQFTAQDRYYREHYSTAQFQVIECPEGNPVGRLYVDRSAREIRIIDIALLPQGRGKGIGTHFLRALQEEARASGKSLSIHVERFNRALNLYQRLGFNIIEDKDVYLLMEWKAE